MTIVIALLVVGAVLLLVETLLPGMIAGIIGAACLIAGVAMGYANFGPEVGTYILMAVVVGLVVGLVVWVRVFPTSRFGQMFISKGTIGAIRAEKPELVGRTGVALTQLRPSGTAVIGGDRVDVVSEGGLIDEGQAIKVVGVEGIRVVVRQVPMEEVSSS